MMPKSVYEALPYCNLVIGSVLIVRYDTFLVTLSGVLFFAVGSHMWAMRSYNRRKDSTGSLRDYGSFNRNWYEFKPFFYMLFGLLTVNRGNSAVLQMLGMIVGLFGLYLLIQRSLHRQTQAPARLLAQQRAAAASASMLAISEAAEDEMVEDERDDEPKQSEQS